MIRGYALWAWMAWHLRQEQARARATPERIPIETLDPEAVESLRNLGYLH